VTAGPLPSARRARPALRTAGVLALLAGIVLTAFLLDHPTLRGGWSWTAVAVLLAAGVTPLLAVRPRPLVPTFTALAVGSLVAYVVVAAPTQREAEASGGAVATEAPYSEPPPQVAPAPTPPPRQHPTLGISTATIEDLDAFILATGTHPEVFDVFESWANDRPLDRYVADSVAARGARLSITWEPWVADGGARQRKYTLASIIDGSHDAYIDTFATSIKQFGHPVTIRLMHEMNGNWYPWGIGVNGNQPGEYVRAWQHVHDRFTALGVTDVAWMWAPNAVYTGSAPLASLYPGDAYVDAVGLSNYNWGRYIHDGFTTEWMTFGELFDDSISEVTALTGRPLWVAETGSSDKGGSKAGWVADTLAEVSFRPDIAGLVWFDQVDDGAGVDWRIESEPDVVAAWSAGYASRPPA
jgi:mannan endo-1,4-beta-mannosidase